MIISVIELLRDCRSCLGQYLYCFPHPVHNALPIITIPVVVLLLFCVLYYILHYLVLQYVRVR